MYFKFHYVCIYAEGADRFIVAAACASVPSPLTSIHSYSHIKMHMYDICLHISVYLFMYKIHI